MEVQPSLMRQSGLMLMESLIAVGVLAIGMLGIAGLHASSLSNNQSALYRTRAVFLAADLVERINLNRANAISYNGWNISAAATPGASITPYAGTDIAVIDQTQWTELLQHRDYGLPSGQATVTVTPQPSTTSTFNITVVLQWEEKNETAQYRLVSLVNSAT